MRVVARDQPAKSRPAKDLQLLEGSFSERGTKRPQALFKMVGRGQAPRSSLLWHWGEGHIYPFCSQMSKVQLQGLSENSRQPQTEGLQAVKVEHKVLVVGPLDHQNVRSRLHRATFQTVTLRRRMYKGQERLPRCAPWDLYMYVLCMFSAPLLA